MDKCKFEVESLIDEELTFNEIKEIINKKIANLILLRESEICSVYDS